MTNPKNLASRDNAVTRQILRLLLRLVCQNFDSARTVAGSDDPSDLLDAAFSWIKAVTFGGVSISRGCFELSIDGVEVSFELSAWEETLLQKYKDLCERDMPF